MNLHDGLAGLAAKATPGPWVFDGMSISDYGAQGPQSLNMEWMPNIEGSNDEDDAALIVALRNNLPAILSALNAADEVKRLREFIVSGQTDVEIRFWSIVDRDGLTGLPSDMWQALECLVARAALNQGPTQ